jgi:hypothetical protein
MVKESRFDLLIDGRVIWAITAAAECIREWNDFLKTRACCDRCRRSPLPFATAIAAPPGASRIVDRTLDRLEHVGPSLRRSCDDPANVRSLNTSLTTGDRRPPAVDGPR